MEEYLVAEPVRVIEPLRVVEEILVVEPARTGKVIDFSNFYDSDPTNDYAVIRNA